MQKKEMKVVTCPKCSGLGEFLIRDYHGTISSSPAVQHVNCSYCNGKLKVKVPEEWTKDKYQVEVREAIHLQKYGNL